MSSCNVCSSFTNGTGTALFASAVKILAAAQCSITYNFVSDNIKDGDKFDFIIVGAGTAGSVVARRLSEVNGWKILLLEAGFPQPVDSIVPYLSNKLLKTKYDWQYNTLYNGKTGQAFKKGRSPWPRGKMLGGCSSMNAMNYVRGYKEDFEVWKNAGNPSWTTKNVFAHFKKAESFQNQKLSKNPNVIDSYGFIGPQILNRFNNSLKIIYENVLNSFNENGFKRVVDFNSVPFKSPGISGYESVTAANGQRYSTYQSYLLPIQGKRKNLNIVTNAFVTKILINKKLRAYGVEVVISNKRINIYADFEIILSCGAINSPQLLMLSGIGPKRHLQSKNIPCKVDLPAVGKYLQDHLIIPIPIYADERNQMLSNNITFEVAKYVCNRTGLLAQSRSADIETFFSCNINSKVPEFQVTLYFFKKNSTSELKNQISYYKKPIINSFVSPNINKSCYFFRFSLLHPLSRGTILLNTSNPYDKPLINPNYFGNLHDLQSVSNGIRLFTSITNTTYFKSINAFLHRIKIPECNYLTLNSDQYWKCQAKNTVYTLYHPVGTTKMGPNRKDSVVDNFLKVHNVDSLRVIDAGVMPYIPSSNTNAPTIMIGEMGATMIKENYGKSS